MNPATGNATIYLTSQAPHAHRTLFAIVAGLPEHMIRIVSPGLGGGFGNKVPIYPLYVCATAASLLIGRPVKWIEDRTGNLISTGFARDFHMHGELALQGERLVQNAAYELGVDPSELRLKNFIQPEQFPYVGFEYDSGDYPKALKLALERLGYNDLRREQAEARAEGRLIGIGLACFTEVVGAGPGKIYDIAGLRMFDSAELRVHPTGKAILKLGVKSQGQGHETTFAQIIAQELGIPYEDVEVQEGDTDNTPYGLGTYASRSTPVAGAAAAMISRELREGTDDRRAPPRSLRGRPRVGDGPLLRQGSPDRSTTIQDIAFAAYTNLPDGLQAGLEGVHYYDPPNMTFPFRSWGA